MTLFPDEKTAIINYRVEKAFQTLKEAVDNANLRNWSLTANRLYYATFYMVLAINLSNDESSKTHAGAFNLFSLRYIASGVLSKDEGSLYRTLYSMRQSGDYDDLFDWEEADILPLIPRVESLLQKMLTLVVK